jgi:transcriptional regulator of heat shock response
MLNERQAYILSAVIREYVETAEPVASAIIASKYRLDVSPATIRNDMVVLEELGFLRQPHTSSGRVPTEDGYRLYLKLMQPRKTPAKLHPPLRQAIEEVEDAKDQMRQLAKALVKISGESAFATLDDGWRYYTGFTELFQKPDFQDMASMRALSTVVDRFDEVMKDLFKNATKDMDIWIGSENPLSNEMATVMVKYRMPNGITGVVGLMGPTRMDYQKNMELIHEARQLLED